MKSLDRYIALKMKKEDKELLRQKKLMSELKPQIKTLTALARFRNADKTGDDDPKTGDSWKEYWQIFTQEDFPGTCPMCGKPLKEDDISGCHINFGRLKLFLKEGEDSYTFEDTKFIVPGHQDCNVKFGEEFTSHITVTAVEAIKK